MTILPDQHIGCRKKKPIPLTFLFLFVVGLFCVIEPVAAQSENDKKDHNVFGAFLTVPVEFPIIDKSALDQRLRTMGFPAAAYPVANLGLGLQLFTGRSIFTFSFNKTTVKDEQDTYLTEVEYRATSFNLGYDILKNLDFSLYPYVGLKGSGLNYLYRERIPDEIPFDTYLQTNLRYKEVTNSRAHLDVGAGFSHQFYYLLNARIGYLLPIEKIWWNSNNNKTLLANAPGIDYKFYFTITLGLGGISNY